MKHTKGKWECSEVGNFSDTLVSFINSGELPIAQTRGATTDGRTVEEITANAKLIAAAPELLECLDYVLGSFSLERTENFDLLNKCKEAIKKATE